MDYLPLARNAGYSPLTVDDKTGSRAIAGKQRSAVHQHPHLCHGCAISVQGCSAMPVRV